jgi:LysR family pca operon transcriptional activator
MNPASVSLRHIRVFVDIVSNHSLRKAARSLNVTESAVSKCLRELETALGTTLLNRGRKGATLTPAGEAFYLHAAQTVWSFANALEAAQNKGVALERLRIGALPTAAAHVVREGVQRLLQDHPGYAVHVESGPYEHLVQRLRTGELDLIVGRMVPRENMGLSFEWLFEEDIVAVVRPGHPLAGSPLVGVQDLSTHLVIMPSPGTQVRATVDTYLFAAEQRPTLQHLNVQSPEFSRAYTLASDAVWFTPRGLVQPDLGRGWLVELPLNSPLLHAPFGLTLMTDASRSRVAALFIEVLRGVCARLQT